MVVGFRWVTIGAVVLACRPQPAAAPPPEEPPPPAAVAPVVAPNDPPSASTTSTPAAAPSSSSAAAPNPASSALEFGILIGPGRLPPEVIQGTVRKSYGVFRKCYETGLGRNRELKGRVSARFLIERDGTVSNVSNDGSDLPDPEVILCVLNAFNGIRFDQPDGGTVTVVYPVMLEPEPK